MKSEGANGTDGAGEEVQRPRSSEQAAKSSGGVQTPLIVAAEAQPTKHEKLHNDTYSGCELQAKSAIKQQ